MTTDQRNELRAAIDAARRERAKVFGREFSCRGCGSDYDSFTDGCGTCVDRRYQRRRKHYTPTHTCRGCGVDYDTLNPACRTCRERSKRRGFGRNGDYQRVPA